MEVVKTHVAGVDVHKDVLTITTLVAEPAKEPTVNQFECKTFTEDLIQAGQKLLDMGIKDVAMESTGIYWKPIHNVWAPMDIQITLGQAAHIKNVPGRKTDMNDSRWIAQLHRFGLIRPSMIPSDAFQRIRLFSRHRTGLVHDLNRVKNRIQKTLEDGNIKLGISCFKRLWQIRSSSFKAPGRRCNGCAYIVFGSDDEDKRKEDVFKSLTNCFTQDHCFMIKNLMDQYDHLNQQISLAEEKIKDLCRPYEHLIDELVKIPGIDKTLAQSILERPRMT